MSVLKGSPFMNCYRCGRKCLRSVDACPSCGCVAFVNGLKPSWPPTYVYACEGRYRASGIDCRWPGPHAVSPGAFLLGDFQVLAEPLRTNKGGR